MPTLSHDAFDLHSADQVPDSYSWPSSFLHDHPSPHRTPSTPSPSSTFQPSAASLVGAACRSFGVFYATATASPPTSSAMSKLRPGASSPSPSTGNSSPPVFPASSRAMAGLLSLPSSPNSCDDEMTDRAGLMKEMILAVDALQLNSYPPCPEPEKAMGMAPHTDSGLLTVLHQNGGTRGLQILRGENGSGPARWVAVPPLAGALVIHVGDLLQILSNGQFRSVRHRAVVNAAEHRISVAYIIGPPGHVKTN
ncbi:Gibberellin 3-beta-dioxygenase 1 [Platanthera guangdongensis]|uniref:Gibberellin 3-beta-dioxygenase 1 n=1 Tax=Platanthera guangdongensis TaxID=2320717 RepID=A0ABR2M0M5_9ASPA